MAPRSCEPIEEDLFAVSRPPALLAATAAWAGDGTILRPKDARLIKDQYIVQFNAGVNARGLASQLTAVHGGRVLHVYEHALKGVAVAMTEQQAQGLALNPNVLLVEQDSLFTIDASGSQ
ncbi:MAG TPA: protease inhibitor I9 family protein, partial [Thermoanaerobaculia bacterium]